MILPEGFELAEFKPCVFYVDGLKVTEMLLEDTCIVWVPWGPYTGHAVDCGYSTDGRLVGMRIWDDVRTRPAILTDEASTLPGDR